LHNLRAQPRVEIQTGRPATAAVVERDDPEFPRLWERVNDNNANRYDGYQRRTERPIPVITLTPD
jgi:deazaflavin-dependent oxidoreductase (nitroreductase family)